MWGIKNWMGEDGVYQSAGAGEHGSHAGMGSHGNEDWLVLVRGESNMLIN